LVEHREGQEHHLQRQERKAATSGPEQNKPALNATKLNQANGKLLCEVPQQGHHSGKRLLTSYNNRNQLTLMILMTVDIKLSISKQ